jgi:hypothetical protein
MSDKEQSASSTSPNKGPIRPKLVRFAEAAFIVAFFMLVKLLMLYCVICNQWERIRWRVIAILPTRNDKNR